VLRQQDVSEEVQRPLLKACLIGVAVGLVVLAVAFAIVAIPFVALATFAEPGQGLDRPLIRDGVSRVALPAGLVVGLVTGGVVAWWYRRGGHLPTPSE
jgi:hypothetical protein